MSPTLTDRILVTLQRVLPARSIGRVIYHLTRSELRWLKNALITGFSWLYSVDTTEAEKPVPDGYRSFNEFFTRSLKTGARIMNTGASTFICPADGTIAQLGKATDGQLLQAKGIEFSASDLLADTSLASELADCHFATIYLAPYNYHRLHMPLDGVLEQTIFVPGLLYSVNARTAATVPNLYAVNERLVCQFNNQRGRFAMVLVGAMNVASISTAWSGEITPPANGEIQKQYFSGTDTPTLSQGDYMGHFNMGSTIVLLGPSDMANWITELVPGTTVQVGQQLGKMTEVT
jgi:phosphatidylserine decarboxylase